MKTVRLSLAGIQRYCGGAAQLSEQFGAGRAAAVSTAAHAIWADAPEAETLYRRLSDTEKADLATWHRPTDVEVGGHVLRYADAHKEQRVGLKANGTACAYDDPERVTQGTADFVWVVHTEQGKLAYVGDLKKSERTPSADPDSLQLVGYGFGAAGAFGCDGFVTGIWHLEEGTWNWSERIVWLDSEEALELWDTLLAAVTNIGERSTGPHCRECYARTQCPEWTLPSVLQATDLAALTEGAEVTNESLSKAVVLAQGLKDLAEKALDTAKALVEQGHEVRANGKIWRGSEKRGREYINVAKARQTLGAAAEPLIQRGSSYQEYRWVKE